MANDWHYTKGDQQIGPVSASELKAAVASGDLTPTSQVWKDGMAEWKPAANIKGLFDGAPVQTNPVPETPPPSSATALIANKATKPSAMSSLLSTVKSAAQFAAKQAERTKLTTITLPAQYQPLGKHCYATEQHRAEFPDLFQKLDAIRSQLANIAKSLEGKPTPQSLGDKAKATAGKAMQAAQSQKLSMQQPSLFGALGKAVYEAHGENSGPLNLTAPIAASVARLAELEADISRLSSEGKGSWITPKRLAIAGAVVVGLFGVMALSAMRDGVQGGKTTVAESREGDNTPSTSEASSAISSSSSQQQNQITSHLTSYYSTNPATEPNESWALETVITFPQPTPSGHVFLLPNDTFAYCATDFPLRVCEVKSSKELTIVSTPGPPYQGIRHSDSAHSILWGSGLSPKDGATLVSWNYQNKSVKARLKVQQSTDKAPLTTEGTYSPDAKLIATASGDNGTTPPTPVRIWDATTLTTLYEAKGRLPIAFSPDGAMLAFGDYKNTGSDGCILWDYKAEKRIAILKRPNNDAKYGRVQLLAFIPHTPLLAVVWSDPSYLIELWNSRTYELVAVLESKVGVQRQDVFSLAASPDGQFLVTGGKDVKVWHLPSGGRTATLGGCKGFIESISIAADGNRIAASTDKKQAAFWTRAATSKGEFAYSGLRQQYEGDPIATKVQGPNGEKVMVGGDGLDTDWFYHYYIDKNGKKVMHGHTRVKYGHSKSALGREESVYDRGELLTRTVFTERGEVDTAYKRRKDGSHQVDRDRSLSKGLSVHLRSVADITTTNNGESIKERYARIIVWAESTASPKDLLGVDFDKVEAILGRPDLTASAFKRPLAVAIWKTGENENTVVRFSYGDGRKVVIEILERKSNANVEQIVEEISRM